MTSCRLITPARDPNQRRKPAEPARQASKSCGEVLCEAPFRKGSLLSQLNTQLNQGWPRASQGALGRRSESQDTREMDDLKSDDSFTLRSKNERIARCTRNGRPQNRSGSSTLEHKCVSVVKKQWRTTSSGPKMTRVSHFAPKTSESHDTRDMSALKTAADHQLWNASV